MIKARAMTGAALLALAAIALTGAAPAASATTIEIDAGHVVGTLKDLRGVNGAPDLTFIKQGSGPPATQHFGAAVSADVSAGYREAHVDLVRTHDSDGAADLDPHKGTLASLIPGMPADAGAWRDANVIFPDPSADPSDPKSYNFGPTDRLISGIEAIGAGVIFRLGREGMTTAPPPQDMARYGEVIRHVVMHYNRGWANGFHDNIKYWEVWNEPDLGQIWWRGTPQQYYQLYAAAARAVKSADPTALIGGPTIALVNQPTPWRDGFLQFVHDQRLPLDFFAWHWYSVDANDPYDFVRIGRDMRALLDEHGFRRTQSVLDEWNYGIHDLASASPAHRAAFVATSLIYMQDAPIDREALYRADRNFGADGKTPDRTGQALIALGRMAATPQRLAVAGAGDQGLAVEAGRSADGGLIQVVISNYRIPAQFIGPREGEDVMHEHGLFDLALPPRRTVSYDGGPVRLRLEGLVKGARFDVERYLMNERQDMTLIGRSTVTGGELEVSDDLVAPAIELLVIRRLAR